MINKAEAKIQRLKAQSEEHEEQGEVARQNLLQTQWWKGRKQGAVGNIQRERARNCTGPYSEPWEGGAWRVMSSRPAWATWDPVIHRQTDRQKVCSDRTNRPMMTQVQGKRGNKLEEMEVGEVCVPAQEAKACMSGLPSLLIWVWSPGSSWNSWWWLGWPMNSQRPSFLSSKCWDYTTPRSYHT